MLRYFSEEGEYPYRKGMGKKVANEERKGDYRFKVLIVDDEPMAVRAIAKVIEKHCPAYEVVDCAGDGEEGLSVLRKVRPDLVLTDIAMPKKSGHELAREAREELPQVNFVVISGYQDFENMRLAIQSGVLDYIAKPIVPTAIVAMMERVRGKLWETYFSQRNLLLRRLCLGEEVKEEELVTYFPCPCFYAALIRENGLPRRFSRSSEPELFGTNEEAYCVYGRDSMEELFLFPATLMEQGGIEDYMEKIFERRKEPENYVTLLYYGKAFKREKLQEKVRNLFHALNAISCVGVSQKKNLDEAKDLGTDTLQSMEEVEGFIRELSGRGSSHSEQMQSRISQAFATWAEQRRPQVWMELAARRILSFLWTGSGDMASLLESEYLLEDAFYHAGSFATLWENLSGIFYRFREEEKDSPKVDSEEFFAQIQGYLKKNQGEQISLSALSERFHISQAYMSRLFRKYASASFNQYLTSLRMEEAKRLMQEEQGLFVKDIARLVGYQDQFYFSRVFRSYTGKSPAEFLRGEM